MPSVSNIAVGALVAGAAASKARHGMNESIARLSTGMRSCMEEMQRVNQLQIHYKLDP